jgi:hypothetical protein
MGAHYVYQISCFLNAAVLASSQLPSMRRATPCMQANGCELHLLVCLFGPARCVPAVVLAVELAMSELLSMLP